MALLPAAGCAGLLHGALAARAPAAALLADQPRGAFGPWRVRGVLASDPYALGDAWQLDLQVRSVLVEGIWRGFDLRVRTVVYDGAGRRSWTTGRGFEAFLSLRPERPARNPLVPPRAPLAASGADLRSSLKSFRQLRARAPAPHLLRTVSAVRTAVRDTVDARFGPEAPLVRALILGERGTVERSLTDALARTGLIHLLAVSGLHVGIVVGALFGLLRIAGLARPHAAIVVTAMLPLLYALVVPRPPVTRACLMAAALLVGVACGRRGAPLHGLALATVLLTVADPWVTMSFGFRLSTAATAAIVVAAAAPIAHRWGWVVRWPAAALGVSVAAQLGVAPLLAAATFRLPILPLALNLVAVPLLAGALVAALATVSLDLAGAASAAAAAGRLCTLSLDALRHAAVEADARTAALTVHAGAISSVGLAALALLAVLATWRANGAAVVDSGGARRSTVGKGQEGPPAHRVARSMRSPPRALCAVLALVAAVCLGLAVRALRQPVLLPPEAFRLVAFDIGQGDALLVEGVDATVMVDTGGSPVSDFDPGTAVLAPALRARGIDALDAVVVTHLDADHAGGLAGLLDEIDVAEVWTTAFAADTAAGSRLLEAASEVPVRTPSAGAAARIGGCAWRVLHPPALPTRRRPALASNDRSLIIALRCGRRALLLTGDGERAAEARYAPSLSLPEGTLLKSPHHGSRTSSGAPLLDALAARHVVISAGWRNRFGLPDAVVLERYRSRGMAVYRTDRDGAVTVNAGRRIRVSGERWSAGRGRRAVGGWLN